MLKYLVARLAQGHRTSRFPKLEPTLPDRFQGRPELDPTRCPEGCARCAEVCPTDAITLAQAGPALDMGRCLFCGECAAACPEGALRFTSDYRLATRGREDLVVRGAERPRLDALSRELERLWGRSLKLRQVSAGGCNGCESDVNVLSTVVFDLARFGIQVVASPRHADGLLITGPVTQNMRLALEKTYHALPPPRLVIAVGACAIAGGPYRDHPEVMNGAASVVPVDLFIPGCPPHPFTILDGLLGLFARWKRGPRGPAP